MDEAYQSYQIAKDFLIQYLDEYINNKADLQAIKNGKYDYLPKERVLKQEERLIKAVLIYEQMQRLVKEFKARNVHKIIDDGF